MPDLIRHPVPHHHWIAGQARNDKDGRTDKDGRNDKTMRRFWRVGHSTQSQLRHQFGVVKRDAPRCFRTRPNRAVGSSLPPGGAGERRG
jgi:hypothetical protein